MFYRFSVWVFKDVRELENPGHMVEGSLKARSPCPYPGPGAPPTLGGTFPLPRTERRSAPTRKSKLPLPLVDTGRSPLQSGLAPDKGVPRLTKPKGELRRSGSRP